MQRDLFSKQSSASGFWLDCFENSEISDMPLLQALQFLGTHGEKFLVAMLLGYPAVKFFRTAPRKNTNITWK